MAKKAARDPEEEGCISCLCLAKWLFSPIILLVMSFRIYVLGAAFAYIERLGRGVFCGLCVCANCTFKDRRFPRDHRSIGAFKGKSGAALDKEVTWRRIGEVCAVAAPPAPKGKGGPSGSKPKKSARLFAEGIEPTDICQGALGDCWLMSALACLACQQGAIQQIFLTREYNMYGRYKVRLYDGIKRRWRTVVVDDYVPCGANGQPLFAKPHGDEAWVVLLEKAAAKFMGGRYDSLDGNLMIKALEMLTGDFVCMFRLGDKRDAKSHGQSRQNKRWTRLELARGPPPKNATPGDDLRLVYARDEPFDGELMFRSIKWEMRHGSTIGASNGGGNDTEVIHGIVQGHAYAIIGAEETDGKRFLRLRNPWGTFEWSGHWSDKSSMWQQHPKVKAALDFKPTNDGAFWMEWNDFVGHFNTLEFCCRSTGFDHVVIDIHEEHPCCGPCWGCFEGCFRYWLCCLGCKALFCGRKVTRFKRPPQGCCGCIA